MTQIVKANVLKAIFLKYLLMLFRNIIRAVRLAVFEFEFNIFFTKKLSIFISSAFKVLKTTGICFFCFFVKKKQSPLR